MARRERQWSVGVDVSAKWIDVERGAPTEAVVSQRWPNTASGHRQVARWLTQGGACARVVLEATGTYSLDLAMCLHQTRGIEVMVINPRVSKDFAGACGQRARTDATAAHVLREFAARMAFTPWQPPSAAVLELRAVMRRVATLVALRVQEQNRLHALDATAAAPPVVRRDVREQIKTLAQRVARLEREARALVEAAPALRAAYGHLRSVRGIGQRSALALLSELAILPRELSVRQWVAYAGLDPRPLQSGSSVHPPVRISKRGNVHLRRILFMPALVAVRWEPAVQRFATQLTDRRLAPLQVLVAVMRKLLHAIYGMLKTDTDFDGEKFRRSVPMQG
jgi:transposase